MPVGINISFRNSSGGFTRDRIFSGDDENISGDMKILKIFQSFIIMFKAQNKPHSVCVLHALI